MSRGKLIAIGIFILVAAGAGTAQYFWKLRQDATVQEDAITKRSRSLRNAADELGRQWGRYNQERGQPPESLDLLAAYVRDLPARLREASAGCGGRMLDELVVYVRPVAQPLPQQPLFIIHSGRDLPEHNFAVLADGKLKRLTLAEADAYWAKARSLARLAAEEDRGISAADWGDEFLD